MLKSQGQVAKISTNTEELRADPKEDPTEDPISGTGGWEESWPEEPPLLTRPCYYPCAWAGPDLFLTNKK